MQELDSIEILFADYTEDDFDRMITCTQEGYDKEPYPSCESTPPLSPTPIINPSIRYSIQSKDRFIHPPPADRLIQEVESMVRAGPPSKKQKSLLSLVALKEEVDDLRTQLELSHEMLMNLIVLNNKNS
jgi:hypothetical protein